MPKKLIRKFLPHRDVIVQNRWIKLLVPRLRDPSLWHINRRSCSGAVAMGVFCAFVPVPFQMVIAAMLAIWLRLNILIAVPMVWISNPLTIPPLFYFCYLVGARLLNIEASVLHFELSYGWLSERLAEIWQPFLLGCFVVGGVLALVSFLLVRTLWRMHIISYVKERAQRIHNRRRARREAK